MRNTFKILPVIFLLLLNGCSLIKNIQPITKPEISIKDVRLSNISLSDVKLDIGLNVENKNNFSIKIPKVNYNIAINGLNTGSGSKSSISIPSLGIEYIRIPVTVGFRNLPQIFKSLIEKKALKYRINGDMSVNAGITNISFPFVTEKELSPF